MHAGVGVSGRLLGRLIGWSESLGASNVGASARKEDLLVEGKR